MGRTEFADSLIKGMGGWMLDTHAYQLGTEIEAIFAFSIGIYCLTHSGRTVPATEHIAASVWALHNALAEAVPAHQLAWNAHCCEHHCSRGNSFFIRRCSIACPAFAFAMCATNCLTGTTNYSHGCSANWSSCLPARMRPFCRPSSPFFAC